MKTSKSQVVSVNKSKQRGIKEPVTAITLIEGGVKGDIHQNSHREVSLLDKKHIDDYLRISQAKENPGYGAFAENITTENLPEDIRVFDYFTIGETRLQLTQIGKPYHEDLEFPGHYVSPQKALFCKVLKGGTIQPKMRIIHHPKIFKSLIITLSDRGSQKIYDDKSGPIARQYVSDFFAHEHLRAEISDKIIPDDPALLTSLLKHANDYDLIITTGGTGISEKDITIETIRPLLDKEIPGITEMIRWKYGLQKPNTLLSRSLAGTIKQTLIFCIPGSPKAVQEYMTEINTITSHAFRMLYGLSH